VGSTVVGSLGWVGGIPVAPVLIVAGVTTYGVYKYAYLPRVEANKEKLRLDKELFDQTYAAEKARL